MAPYWAPLKTGLAQLPTPVQKLPRLSEQLGVSLYVKRDDLTGAALSGNKVRKLEYLVADAVGLRATTLITCGGIQSNHARATAIAARRMGLVPRLLLRTPDGKPPAEVDGNYLIDRLVGAEIRTITPDQWKDRTALMEAWAKEVAQRGETPYVIPEGGSNALGSVGYVEMVRELSAQMTAMGRPFPEPDDRSVDYLVHATGSGGTTAGLALGAETLRHGIMPVGFAVCDDESYFRGRVQAIASEFEQRFDAPGVAARLKYLVLDRYKGVGYALSTPEELAFIQEIARTEGLLLDPVYTGKAFFGMVQELRQGKTFRRGSTVIFVHTGGIFGLFPKRFEFTW